MLSEREIAKIKRIQEMLQVRLSSPSVDGYYLESVVLLFKDLDQEPLLKDRTGVK